jgi:hypothetical protein
VQTIRSDLCRPSPRIKFLYAKISEIDFKGTKIEEMYHFALHQSHISEKNIDRLRALLDDSDEDVRTMAYVLIRVAAIRPSRRKRLRYIVQVDQSLAKEFIEIFFGGEWIDPRYETYDEPMSFDTVGDDVASMQGSFNSDRGDLDVPF